MHIVKEFFYEGESKMFRSFHTFLGTKSSEVLGSTFEYQMVIYVFRQYNLKVVF